MNQTVSLPNVGGSPAVAQHPCNRLVQRLVGLHSAL